jgi:hypothetical protein
MKVGMIVATLSKCESSVLNTTGDILNINCCHFQNGIPLGLHSLATT